MRKLPLWQAFVVLLFFSISFDAASLFLRSLGGWLAEIHYYWLSGWDFSLPPPRFRVLAGLPRLERPAGFGRLLLEWPFLLLVRFGICRIGLELIWTVLTGTNLGTPLFGFSARSALNMMIIALAAYVGLIGMFAATETVAPVLPTP